MVEILSLDTIKSTSLVADAEINGSVNVAAQLAGNSQFKLVLATLEQNLLNRLRLAVGNETDVVTSESSVVNNYPVQPLKVSEETWIHAQEAKKHIELKGVDSVRLWQIMHPDPLSLFNDPLKLEENVVANTSYHTQLTLKAQSNIKESGHTNLTKDEPDTESSDNILEQDPTMLYDILSDLKTPKAA